LGSRQQTTISEMEEKKKTKENQTKGGYQVQV
jgi:hypothetical protein